LSSNGLIALLREVRHCRVCERHLPFAPRPLLQAARSARILIVGQAPGARAHATGIPWNDASGARLRAWLGLDSAVFYDASTVAIIPVGFCYPGRGRAGDLAPRPECAPLWFAPLLARLPRIELVVLAGRHSQRHVLGALAAQSLTATVREWRQYAPRCYPLPHPSPRNQAWLKRNPWFERELIPELRARVYTVLAGDGDHS